MPRDGSSVYHIPTGTEGFPDTTIESNKYNVFIHDVETDLNTPRPISAGGTGSNSANGALATLGGEKSSQLVTNYDTHVFYPGSFYSAAGATNAPVAGHSFVGIAISSDAPAPVPLNQNVLLRAYDQSSTSIPGRYYTREKKAGVWTTVGWALDNTGLISADPPATPEDGTLWWDNETGQLYVYYRDVNSTQWVIASPAPDPAQFVMKSGDSMTGTLALAAAPTAPTHAANKQYVDAGLAAALATINALEARVAILEAAP